jgi:predicted SAM-dependent methyltransferase
LEESGDVGVGSSLRLWRRRRRFAAAIASSDVIRLNVGSGGTSYPGWFSMDRNLLDITKRRNWERLLRGRLADNVLAEHVLEHLEEREIISAFRNIARFLETGGVFRMAVPDGNHPSEYVRDLSKPGGLEPGAEDHKVFLTIRDVARLEQSSGLRAEPIEYFDDEGRFEARPMRPDRGHIKRSAEHYRGRFTESRTEMDRLISTSPPHLRKQFEEKGLSGTSLIVDWVKV